MVFGGLGWVQGPLRNKPSGIPQPASTDDVSPLADTLRKMLMRRYVSGVGRERFYSRVVFPNGIGKRTGRVRGGALERKEGHVRTHTKGLSVMILEGHDQPLGTPGSCLERRYHAVPIMHLWDPSPKKYQKKRVLTFGGTGVLHHSFPSQSFHSVC